MDRANNSSGVCSSPLMRVYLGFFLSFQPLALLAVLTLLMKGITSFALPVNFWMSKSPFAADDGPAKATIACASPSISISSSDDSDDSSSDSDSSAGGIAVSVELSSFSGDGSLE